MADWLDEYFATGKVPEGINTGVEPVGTPSSNLKKQLWFNRNIMDTDQEESPGLGKEFTESVKGTLHGMASNIAGAGSMAAHAVGANWLDDYLMGVSESQKEKAAEHQTPGSKEELTLMSALKPSTISRGLGNVIPQIPTTVIPSWLGRGAGMAIGGAMAGPAGAAAGGWVGAALGGMFGMGLQEMGESYTQQYEQTGVKGVALPSAAGLAAAAFEGALDSRLPGAGRVSGKIAEKIGGRYGTKIAMLVGEKAAPDAIRKIAAAGMIDSAKNLGITAAHGVGGFIKGGGIEYTEEYVQTILESLPSQITKGESILSDEVLANAHQAGLSAVGAGAVLGTGGGVYERHSAIQDARNKLVRDAQITARKKAQSEAEAAREDEIEQSQAAEYESGAGEASMRADIPVVPAKDTRGMGGFSLPENEVQLHDTAMKLGIPVATRQELEGQLPDDPNVLIDRAKRLYSILFQYKLKHEADLGGTIEQGVPPEGAKIVPEMVWGIRHPEQQAMLDKQFKDEFQNVSPDRLKDAVESLRSKVKEMQVQNLSMYVAEEIAKTRRPITNVDQAVMENAHLIDMAAKSGGNNFAGTLGPPPTTYNPETGRPEWRGLPWRRNLEVPEATPDISAPPAEGRIPYTAETGTRRIGASVPFSWKPREKSEPTLWFKYPEGRTAPPLTPSATEPRIPWTRRQVTDLISTAEGKWKGQPAVPGSEEKLYSKLNEAAVKFIKSLPESVRGKLVVMGKGRKKVSIGVNVDRLTDTEAADLAMAGFRLTNRWLTKQVDNTGIPYVKSTTAAATAGTPGIISKETSESFAMDQYAPWFKAPEKLTKSQEEAVKESEAHEQTQKNVIKNYFANEDLLRSNGELKSPRELLEHIAKYGSKWHSILAKYLLKSKLAVLDKQIVTGIEKGSLALASYYPYGKIKYVKKDPQGRAILDPVIAINDGILVKGNEFYGGLGHDSILHEVIHALTFARVHIVSGIGDVSRLEGGGYEKAVNAYKKIISLGMYPNGNKAEPEVMDLMRLFIAVSEAADHDIATGRNKSKAFANLMNSGNSTRNGDKFYFQKDLAEFISETLADELVMDYLNTISIPNFTGKKETAYQKFVDIIKNIVSKFFDQKDRANVSNALDHVLDFNVRMLSSLTERKIGFIGAGNRPSDKYAGTVLNKEVGAETRAEKESLQSSLFINNEETIGNLPVEERRRMYTEEGFQKNKTEYENAKESGISWFDNLKKSIKEDQERLGSKWKGFVEGAPRGAMPKWMSNRLVFANTLHRWADALQGAKVLVSELELIPSVVHYDMGTILQPVMHLSEQSPARAKGTIKAFVNVLRMKNDIWNMTRETTKTEEYVDEQGKRQTREVRVPKPMKSRADYYGLKVRDLEEMIKKEMDEYPVVHAILRNHATVMKAIRNFYSEKMGIPMLSDNPYYFPDIINDEDAVLYWLSTKEKQTSFQPLRFGKFHRRTGSLFERNKNYFEIMDQYLRNYNRDRVIYEFASKLIDKYGKIIPYGDKETVPPDGYVEWRPPASVGIVNRILAEIYNENPEFVEKIEDSELKEEVKKRLGTVAEAMRNKTSGGINQRIFLPEGMVEFLNQTEQAYHPVEKFIKKWTGKWKGAAIVWAGVPFQVTQVISDSMMMYLVNSSAFRNGLKAAKAVLGDEKYQDVKLLAKFTGAYWGVGVGEIPSGTEKFEEINPWLNEIERKFQQAKKSRLARFLPVTVQWNEKREEIYRLSLFMEELRDRGIWDGEKLSGTVNDLKEDPRVWEASNATKNTFVSYIEKTKFRKGAAMSGGLFPFIHWSIENSKQLARLFLTKPKSVAKFAALMALYAGFSGGDDDEKIIESIPLWMQENGLVFPLGGVKDGKATVIIARTPFHDIRSWVMSPPKQLWQQGNPAKALIEAYVMQHEVFSDKPIQYSKRNMHALKALIPPYAQAARTIEKLEQPDLKKALGKWGIQGYNTKLNLATVPVYEVDIKEAREWRLKDDIREFVKSVIKEGPATFKGNLRDIEKKYGKRLYHKKDGKWISEPISDFLFFNPKYRLDFQAVAKKAGYYVPPTAKELSKRKSWLEKRR